MNFEEADKKVHPVETQWHYPIMTKYGYEAMTKEGVGFVRTYMYVHPTTHHMVEITTGSSADYWNAGYNYGYWSDLEPYLKSLVDI